MQVVWHPFCLCKVSCLPHLHAQQNRRKRDNIWGRTSFLTKSFLCDILILYQWIDIRTQSNKLLNMFYAKIDGFYLHRP